MQRICLRIWAFILAVGLVSAQLPDDVKNNINNGLSLASSLSTIIEKGQFSTTLTKLATSVGPYLGAIGPIVGFFTGLFGTQESAELSYLKHMFTEIDNRFNRLDGQFDEVKRKIEWSTVEVKFGELEQKILAVSKEFQKVYNVPVESMKSQAQLFVINYESDFQNSATKLYDGIMNENGQFSQSLGDAVRHYTKNDRHQVQQFLLGILKLILQGAKLELAYLKAKGPQFTGSYTYTENDWKIKINRIKIKMEQIDQQIVKDYLSQVDSDVQKFATDNNHMSNHDFVGALYRMLDTKYYWRDWMVLAFKPLPESDRMHHKVHACGGFVKHQLVGRDLVVASVDEHTNHINIINANAMLAKIPLTFSFHLPLPAETVFNSFPVEARTTCSPYAAAGLVRWGQDVWFHVKSSRFTLARRDPYFHLFMFG